MIKSMRRRSGAQPGNHNALKHGFYSKNKVVVERDRLPARLAVKELDHDVALSRATLMRLYAKDPDNVELITRTLSLHDRLLRTRQLLIDRQRRAKRRSHPSHPNSRSSTLRRQADDSGEKDITAGPPSPSFPKVETPYEERIGGGIEGGFRRRTAFAVRGTTSFKPPQTSLDSTARKCHFFGGRK